MASGQNTLLCATPAGVCFETQPQASSQSFTSPKSLRKLLYFDFCILPHFLPFQSQGLYFLLLLTSSICKVRIMMVSQPEGRESATVSSSFRCEIYDSITLPRVVAHLGEGGWMRICSWTLLVRPSSSGQAHLLFSQRVFAFSASFESSILKSTTL